MWVVIYASHANDIPTNMRCCVLLWLGNGRFTNIFQAYFSDTGQSYDYPRASEVTLNNIAE